MAATRAIRNLYLFAAVKPRKNGEVKATTGTLLGELWPAIQAEQAPLVSFAAAELRKQAEEAGIRGVGIQPHLLAAEYRRLAADWKLPASPGSVQQTPA